MGTFEFEVTLVSGSFDFDLDSTYGADPHEAFDYYFFNHGATGTEYEAYPCLKVGVNSLSNESSLVGLHWDSEFEQFDGATPNYEIQSVSGDQTLGWNYTYHLLIVFSAQISAESLEQAIDKVRNEAFDNLEIYDGGIDETIAVEDVRLILKTEK